MSVVVVVGTRSEIIKRARARSPSLFPFTRGLGGGCRSSACGASSRVWGT
jgi:hypothetical protein